MTTQCPIDIGDKIEMSFSPDDSSIEVSSIPALQPYVETDGVWVIVDQHGEEHLVQQDGDTFVTATTGELSDAGLDKWVEINEGPSPFSDPSVKPTFGPKRL